MRCNNCFWFPMEEKCAITLVCPNCGYEIEDSWDFEGECGEWKCYECDKYFHWSRHVSVSYSTLFECEKNKEEHEWNDWTYCPYDYDVYLPNEVEDHYFRYCKRCENIERVKLKDLQEEK